MILIDDVCQKRMHLQQRVVCQGQMISNMMREDLNANVRRTAGYENAGQGQPVSCSMMNTENAKAGWNNNREERDRELGYRRGRDQR